MLPDGMLGVEWVGSVSDGPCFRSFLVPLPFAASQASLGVFVSLCSPKPQKLWLLLR